MRSDERKAARRRYAVAVKSKIAQGLIEFEQELWKEAAKIAKEGGLYAPSTFVGDIETGLRSYAGMRRYLVRDKLAEVGVTVEVKA